MRRVFMLGADVRSRAGEGLREVVRGWEFGLFLAGSVSASLLLSVHVCRSLDPLDSQDGTVTEKLKPKEDSDANKSCPC